MCDEVNNKRMSFPKGFWTMKRPHVTKEEKKEDMIPFKWSKDVLDGKKEANICSIKKKK